MKVRSDFIRRVAVALAAVASVGTPAACNDDEDDIIGVTAPDLSGTYTIVSFTQAGGTRLVPPSVAGELVLAQTGSSGSEASGTYQLSVTVPNPQGGSSTTNDNGTYTIDAGDGSWTQASSTLGFQAFGTYALQGNTLTVVVTQPLPAANTTEWQRQ